MMVISAPYAEANSQSSGARSSRPNAFRVLSLPADADFKRIRRQQDRLLVEIEMGERTGANLYGLPPLRGIGKEEILEAVHLLQRPRERLLEELFWVHEMNGLMSAGGNGGPGELRETAAASTADGAVARHNLAVMESILGQESAGNDRPSHWKKALDTWKELIDDDLFWGFMKNRALGVGDRKTDGRRMKAAVRQQLSTTFSEELVQAVKSRDLQSLHGFVSTAKQHSSWLAFDAALHFVGQQTVKGGFVSLGALLDLLSGITQQEDKADLRGSLGEQERELCGLAGEYGAVFRSLGEPEDADRWDDAVASFYQRLSVAYLSSLNDAEQALRLIGRARELARDPQLLQSMERDWQNAQRANLCREADVLARDGDFEAAEDKLEAALLISTGNQKTEIQATRELYRWAHEAMNGGGRQAKRAALCRQAGALAQSGDFAGAQEKWEAALAISREEQKPAIKAMQERCRWARVLRAADTGRRNPNLFRFGGTGATLFGKRDYDPGTQSYVTNHWLTFLFVPICPLGSYRVTSADFRSSYIHGKVPLSHFLRAARWAIAATVFGLLVVVCYRAALTKTAGPSVTKVPSSTETPVIAVAPAEKPTNSRHRKRNDIERRRKARTVSAQSLEDRKRELDAEEADLRRQKSYLASVASAYSGQNVPHSGRAAYDAVFADYISSVQKYETKLALLEADFAAYHERSPH